MHVSQMFVFNSLKFSYLHRKAHFSSHCKTLSLAITFFSPSTLSVKKKIIIIVNKICIPYFGGGCFSFRLGGLKTDTGMSVFSNEKLSRSFRPGKCLWHGKTWLHDWRILSMRTFFHFPVVFPFLHGLVHRVLLLRGRRKTDAAIVFFSPREKIILHLRLQIPTTRKECASESVWFLICKQFSFFLFLLESIFWSSFFF